MTPGETEPAMEETPYDRLRRVRATDLRARALDAVRAAEVAARSFGATLRVFGSLAAGRFDGGSDIDLAVSAPAARRAEAVRAVAEAVETRGFACDVIAVEDASPGLRERIGRDGREPRALV